MPTLREQDSLNLIHRCFSYRTLLGKRDDLQLPLSAADRDDLRALDSFLRERPADRPARVPEFAAREHVRRPVQLLVHFQIEGAPPEIGLLRNVSGGGVYVETRRPLPSGCHIALQITDRARGCELRFGVEVVRAERGRGMGLRFQGIPLEVRKHHPPVSVELRQAA